MINTIFIFGFGYTAKNLSQLLIANNYQVFGTSRNKDLRQSAKGYGVTLCDFDFNSIKPLLEQSQAVLICIPPDEQGVDPVFRSFKDAITLNKKNINWIGYLSTTGVYGDHNGAWVTENSAFTNPGERSKRRIVAEQNWLSLYTVHKLPVHIFRLAGIYGAEQSSINRLREGKDYSIFKHGQFFSRIHVEDIARILFYSIKNPTPGETYNIADDCPAAAHEVDQYAAKLLGIENPKLIPYEKANLSPMLLEFYQSNKRISNAKIKKALSLSLLYPSYKEGLKNIMENL